MPTLKQRSLNSTDHSTRSGAAMLALSFALTGCMVGPKYHTPPSVAQTAPTTYKETPTPETAQAASDAGQWKVAQPEDAMLRGKWWQVFNDPELNTLEDRLNIDNQNIKVYFENYETSRALVGEARSQLYPTVGAAPTYQRSRSSGNLGNSSVATSSTGTSTTGPQIATNQGQQNSIGTLPLDVSWQPDLWGRIRNTIRANQYAAQISAADLENERLIEQSSLAQYFFELRGQDALADIFAKTIADDQKSLDYAQAQYDTGVGGYLAVVQAKATLQSAQSTYTNLGVARAQYEHAIAVLLGANPSSFSIPFKPSLVAPPPIPVGMPSELLERRPDIAAAERNMAVANANIGVAYAAFYPDLTLSTSGGFESSTFKHLFDYSSRFWSIGPSISQTVYDGGLRRATVNQYIATYNANVATYRQTVLTAFQQVEDALSTVRIISDQIVQQQAAVQSAQQSLNLELDRYQTGIDPYISVVVSQDTLLTNQQTLAQIQIQQMTAAVQLVQALGGGWDASQLPTPSQVTHKLTKAETQIQR